MNPLPPPAHADTHRARISAMILAAGRGERMRPLTDRTPKPLLLVHGKPLIQWSLEALVRGGYCNVTINTAWLGEQIFDRFGSLFVLQPPQNVRKQLSNQEQSEGQLNIQYSHEGRDFGGALETAGGIARALPLLCPPPDGGEAGASPAHPDAVFWVLAADVFAPDFVFSLAAVDRFVASDKLAHLWLVPNPEHNPRGDFGLAPDPQAPDGAQIALSLAADDTRPRYTYSTMGLYRPALFEPPWCDIPPGNPAGIKAALAPLLRAAMAQQRVSAELYTGRWADVGTPPRLPDLNAA
jgi:MurNAc alpha-1-phosphate uridylyltransferase